MTVVVTGATGFLGRHVVAALLDRGIRTVAGVRTVSTHSPALDVPTVRLDLTVPESPHDALREADAEVVIHCAAYGVDYREQDVAAAIRVNVDGTLRLFEAAQRQGVRRFLHVGTSYEYGDHAGVISEDAPLRPEGVYGASKAAASLLLLAVRRRGLPALTILRPFGMYGPGEGRHKLVPQVLEASRSGTPLDLTEGSEVRDYLPVTDVARGIAELAGLPEAQFPAGAVFNVCSGRGRSIRQFALEVAQAAGAGAGVLRFGRVPSRPDAPARVVGDPARWRSFWRELGRPDVAIESTIGDVITRMQGGG